MFFSIVLSWVWSSLHNQKLYHSQRSRHRTDWLYVHPRIHDAHILICCQVQTNLSARLVSVHSLSSTSLLTVLILTILATNISLLPLWRNYSELQTYVTSLILSKKLILQQVMMFINIFIVAI